MRNTQFIWQACLGEGGLVLTRKRRPAPSIFFLFSFFNSQVNHYWRSGTLPPHQHLASDWCRAKSRKIHTRSCLLLPSTAPQDSPGGFSTLAGVLPWKSDCLPPHDASLNEWAQLTSNSVAFPPFLFCLFLFLVLARLNPSPGAAAAAAAFSLRQQKKKWCGASSCRAITIWRSVPQLWENPDGGPSLIETCLWEVHDSQACIAELKQSPVAIQAGAPHSHVCRRMCAQRRGELAAETTLRINSLQAAASQDLWLAASELYMCEWQMNTGEINICRSPPCLTHAHAGVTHKYEFQPAIA